LAATRVQAVEPVFDRGIDLAMENGRSVWYCPIRRGLKFKFLLKSMETTTMAGMKVAIVHDWLPTLGGAEKVLEQITKLFPGADIYTLFDFLTERQRATFGNCKIHTSYLNKLPGVKHYYRNLLPLFPGAIESFDLSDYDLIISSSYSVAKGVLTSAKQTHISYVHSPARYAWDLTHHYMKQTGSDRGLKGVLTRYLLKRFRIWDYRTANGVDVFISNSEYIAKRIWKVYRREAVVIYPPVDVDRFQCRKQKDDVYLTASRMVPYKRMDLIVEAFTKTPDRKLRVVGEGPEMAKIARIAAGHPNITLLGFLDDAALTAEMQHAKAFIFAAEEDFGIVPVEAQACGTPVIAFKAGGTLETIRDYDANPQAATGLFFEEQTAESLRAAVDRFEQLQGAFDAGNCRINAERFSPQFFRNNLRMQTLIANTKYSQIFESSAAPHAAHASPA
jgi:glycosyltransferase involved in cell wall biosynthesis